MLNDAICFKQIYIVCGYTDMRYGIDSLDAIIKSKLVRDSCDPDTLYLFCNQKMDRIKGLVWERDGFFLLYKRLEKGNFIWPRTKSEVCVLTGQQFRWLMEGLTIFPKKVVREVHPAEYLG